MKTLEHAILNHARLYLGLTEPYQHELSRGLCFGLSATAVVYNAVNQFADYKGLLETLVSSNATPNLALRRLIEAAFFLQSLNLQTMVTGTTDGRKLYERSFISSRSFVHGLLPT